MDRNKHKETKEAEIKRYPTIKTHKKGQKCKRKSKREK
jgi:hypothetical protein